MNSLFTVYDLSCSSRCSAIWAKSSMDRTLTVGAASGSLSAIGLRLLSQLLHTEPPRIPECPYCPVCPELPEFPDLPELPDLPLRLDLASLVVGIVIGASLGPLFDLVYLARQSWRVWLRSRLSDLARRNPEALYRLA